MARLGLLNMLIGFVVLTCAAAAGAFVATETTTAILKDPEMLNAWGAILRRSAHGHANLFGMLHIAFGLTLPYSRWQTKTKALQTAGLFAGTAAMGIGLLLRAAWGATEAIDPIEIGVGVCLSAALLALASHAAGLGARLLQRP
jgi:hypothetical protein